MIDSEKLINVIKETKGYNGRFRYVIRYVNIDGKGVNVYLPIGQWNKSIIIDGLVRSKYSQDHVEAIINNHFLNIAEWLDKKFKGEEVKFNDPEYDELQRWRKQCKVLAEDALEQYPAE